MNCWRKREVLAWAVLCAAGIDLSWSHERDASHPASPATVAAGLMAHWTFDEQQGSVIEEATSHPLLLIRADVTRARGVYGHALELRGTHRLQVRAVATEASLRQYEESLVCLYRPADTFSQTLADLRIRVFH